MMFARAVGLAQAATARMGGRLTRVVAQATLGGRCEHLACCLSGQIRAEGRILRIRGGNGAVIRHLFAGVPPSSSSLSEEMAAAGHDDGGVTSPSDGGGSRVGVEGGDDVTGWDEKRRIREEMVSLAEGAGGDGVDRDYSPATDDSDAEDAGSIIDGGGGANNRIPLQSPQMAMLLFDALAPHLEKRHLRSLSVRLSKFASSHSPSDATADDAGDSSDNSADGGDDVDSPSVEGGRGVGSSGSGSGALPRSKSKLKIHNGLTLVYQLNEYFSAGGGGGGKGGKKNAHHADNNNPWVRPLLCHFLVGYDISGHAGSAGISSSTAPTSTVDDDSVSSSDDSTHSSQSSSVGVTTRNANVWDDPTFPPNANRVSWDGDVSTLLAARETSASGSHGPPSWRGNRSRRRRRRGTKGSPDADADADAAKATSESETEMEMEESLSWALERSSRADVVRAIHSTKSEGRRRAEAEEMASLLADRLPRATHGKLMAFLSEYAAPNDDGSGGEDGLGEEGDGNGRVEERKTRKNRHIRNLGRRLRHILGFHMPLVATELAEFLYVLDVPPSAPSPPDRIDDGGDDDRMMVEAWEEWNDARSTLVDAFLSSQAEYARRPPVRMDTTAVEERQRIVERVTETIAGLNALRADADGVATDAPPGGDTATAAVRERDPSDLTLRRGPKLSESSRRRKAVHIVFDALMLSDERTRQIRSENETVANRRRVFLNNLPVDVTEEEVRTLYGRCGPIERVTVHNLRPDLDPGVLTKKEMAELRKRRKGAFRRGVRRTPIYAVVDFETEGGYDVATGDNLTVFGMVVRKHPVRSIPASRLTSLFIENIPQGHYSMDLEYKISKVLHPEIYVCLDVGDHDYSEPHSCEIKFPSHEIASFAYERLRHLDMGSDDCVVNWMRTPEDAEDYWTRELGFDG